MEPKQQVVAWLKDNQGRFTEMSDIIWAHPEPAHREFKAARLQADFLEAEGFRVTRDVARLKTAFVAEWGSGKPIIGFAGEYDALNGLSQKNQPTPEPVVEGGAGHACGHNLLGVGCLAAAVAVKQWLQAEGRPGTVRYYGCPAEENTYGKTFMARAGLFDDLDAAFNYHPSALNFASKGSAVGVYDLKFRFKGKAAHAGGSPHLGRSALDAVELMNVGVNYLREHITSHVRIHYVITHGGDLPNIVPPDAEVWYFIRAHRREEQDSVTERVKKIAQGAALMTETEVEWRFNAACSSVLSNHCLADLQTRNMQWVGPIQFTPEEMAYAEKINSHFPEDVRNDLFGYHKLLEPYRGQALLGDNLPPFDEGNIETGSTDVGDLSWVTPVAMLNTTCFASGAPGHSWAIVATGAMSIGHKGMMHAAKVMALSAIDLWTDPRLLEEVRAEFAQATGGKKYDCPLPEYVEAPRYEEN